MFDPDEPRPKPQVRYVKPSLRGLRRPDAIPPTIDIDDEPDEPQKTDVALRNGTSLTTVKQSAELTPLKVARVKQIEAATDKIVAETELLMAQAEKEMAGVKQIHAEIADARHAFRRKAEKEEVQTEADEVTKQERSAIRNLSFLCASVAVLFLGVSFVMLAHHNPAYALPGGVVVAFTGMSLKIGFSTPQSPVKSEDK